jgi:hypothetical protein
MDLEKYYELSVFYTFVVPSTAFTVSDSYKSSLSFVMLEPFLLYMPPVGDLVLLAILSECLLFWIFFLLVFFPRWLVGFWKFILHKTEKNSTMAYFTPDHTFTFAGDPCCSTFDFVFFFLTRLS